MIAKKSRAVRSRKRAARKAHKPRLHELIEPGAPSRLSAAIEALNLDLALHGLDDLDICLSAHRLARAIYGNYADVLDAHTQATEEVQKTMGWPIANRLNDSGEAVRRRVVLAAYFLGVHCGRMTQPSSGDAK